MEKMSRRRFTQTLLNSLLTVSLIETLVIYMLLICFAV